MGFMDKVMTWARTRSPWIIHFNTGACNACDIEIVAALTPRFDVERFGLQLKGTPRHADVLVASGAVTRQIQDRLKRIYDQMPEPKFVVAVGTCSCSGGVFQGCYNVKGGIDQVIPVSAMVPGCPPRPEAIIDGVVKLLGSLNPPAPALNEDPTTTDGESPSGSCLVGDRVSPHGADRTPTGASPAELSPVRGRPDSSTMPEVKAPQEVHDVA